MVVFEEYLSQLVAMQNKYNRISKLLTYEEVVLDSKLCQKLQKEKRQLQPIVEKYEKYLQLIGNVKDYYTLIGLSPEDKDAIVGEIDKINDLLEITKLDIINLIDVNGAKWESVVVEIVYKDDIRLGDDIVKAYTNFLINNNLDYKTINIKDGVKLEIDGLSAKKSFLHNIGLHVDENGDSVQVYVYDNIIMPNISFEDRDISITTFRSSGAGGQHINTTDSAIRVVHLPTGISATCQSERSQAQNKRIALETLKNRVIEHYEKERSIGFDNLKKEQVKLMKNKYIAKTYNYEKGVMVGKDKKEIKFKDFLTGKEI